MKTPPIETARILFVDLETSDLSADFGNCYCVGYKWLGEPVKVLSILDHTDPCTRCHRVNAQDDARLMKAAWPILASADVWVTWYGRKFDRPFWNARMINAQLKPLPPVPHIDLYWTARNELKLTSNRLANVQSFLGLDTEKTRLDKKIWRKAQGGHVPSLKYIIAHCKADVEVLEQAYERLKQWVRIHPRVKGYGACRVCGSETLQRRGPAITTTKTAKFRYLCKACGSWETR